MWYFESRKKTVDAASPTPSPRLEASRAESVAPRAEMVAPRVEPVAVGAEDINDAIEMAFRDVKDVAAQTNIR